MNKLKNILVLTDFSPTASDAMRRAHELAVASGAKLQALHVIDEQIVTDFQELTEQPKELVQRELKIEAQTDYAQALVAAGLTQDAVPLRVEVGSPFAAALDLVNEGDIDLVVAGKQGRGSAQLRGGVGAYAAKVLRKLPTKVMLVQRGTGLPRKVLCAVDLSPNSRLALEQAIIVAHLGRHHLEVVNVFPPPWSPGAGRRPAYHVIEEQRRMAQQRLGIFLHGKRGILSELDYSELALESDEPARAIAERLGPTDLLVMGTRGRTVATKAMVIGSHAERLLHAVPSSILAIKPAGFAWS